MTQHKGQGDPPHNEITDTSGECLTQFPLGCSPILADHNPPALLLTQRVRSLGSPFLGKGTSITQESLTQHLLGYLPGTLCEPWLPMFPTQRILAVLPNHL